MTLLALANDRGNPRLGLVISRKAAGAAVARNRIKRLVRESFRHTQTQLGGFDIVVIGHLHIPVRKELPGGLYIHSGDFINHFSYIRIDTNGAELLYLK